MVTGEQTAGVEERRGEVSRGKRAVSVLIWATLRRDVIRLGYVEVLPKAATLYKQGELPCYLGKRIKRLQD